MADGIFNSARGKIAYYASHPLAADSIVVVLLKAANLEGDDTLNNYTTLAAITGSTNRECDFTNYARRTLTITATVDNAANTSTVSAADFTFTAAGGTANNDVGKLLICYKPDTASADSAIIPLTYHDCVVTTTGADIPITVPAGGFWSSH